MAGQRGVDLLLIQARVIEMLIVMLLMTGDYANAVDRIIKSHVRSGDGRFWEQLFVAYSYFK